MVQRLRLRRLPPWLWWVRFPPASVWNFPRCKTFLFFMQCYPSCRWIATRNVCCMELIKICMIIPGTRLGSYITQSNILRQSNQSFREHLNDTDLKMSWEKTELKTNSDSQLTNLTDNWVANLDFKSILKMYIHV